MLTAAAGLVGVAVSLVGVALVTFEPKMGFLVTAGGSLLVVTMPLLGRERYDVFSPWTFVVLTVFFGVTMRTVYMAFDWPDFGTLDELFFLGRHPEFFLGPSVGFLVSLLALQVGFWGLGSRGERASDGVGEVPGLRWNRLRLMVVVTMLSAVSFAALYVFIDLTGGWTWERISAKRTVLVELASYTAHGYLRAANGLAVTAYVLTLSYVAFNRKRLTWWRGAVLGGLFMNAMLLPVYASSRAEAIWPVIFSLAIWYHARRTVTWRVLAAVGLSVLIGFQALTELRKASYAAERGSIVEESAVVDGFNSLVLNRNLLDLARTAHIVNAVPQALDYELGRTMVTWVYAPVPRQLWRDKPPVSVGPEIGDAIYGFGTKGIHSGVPPGLPGELYWNFSWPGVVAGSLLFGWGLRWAQEACCRRWLLRGEVAVFYVVVVMPMGFEVLGGGVSNAVIQTLSDLIPLTAAMYIVGERQSARGEPV